MKCKGCLDNPNMPSGSEHDAEIQICGFWLCRQCVERLEKLDHIIIRLQALAKEPRPNLIGLFD